MGINSGTDQAQAEEESAVVDYTCISKPGRAEEKKLLFILMILARLASVAIIVANAYLPFFSRNCPEVIISNIWN